LTLETEQQLRLQANQRGQTLEAFLSHLAKQEARGVTDAADQVNRSLEWLTRRGPEEIRAAPERILRL